MNIRQLLSNPTGLGSAMVGNREILKKAHDMKYMKYVKEHGRIKIEKFYTKKGEYFIIAKVASESVKDVEYDVVFKFYTENDDIKNSPNLNNYDLQFFSSCPSFVYTYGHAAIKSKLSIKELEKKYPKEVRKLEAEIRNAKSLFGFEKSTQYVARHILANVNLSKTNFTTTGKSLTILSKKIDDYVRSVEDIMKIRAIKAKKQRAKEKAEKIAKQKAEARKKPAVSTTVKNPKTGKSASSVKRITAKGKIGGKKKITGRKKR